jgi:hypothetical protein
VLLGLERMLGHPCARLLILGVCFVALSLPVLSGRAASPSAALLAELFITWSVVVALLALLAVVDRRQAARESGAATSASAEVPDRGAPE